jgi:hypothetical protein
MPRFNQLGVLFLVVVGSLVASQISAADAPDKPAAAETAADGNIVYLNKEHNVWIDKKNKQVVMKGKIAVREGNLEMLACPAGTKEHESIVAVETRAFPVHAALIALGAKVGHPSKFADDKFTPASGSEIDIRIRWKGDDGKDHEARGQDWIRNMKTGKSLEYPWVFGGGIIRVDPDTKEQNYSAEGGDFICVANFPTAMMDLPIESPRDWSAHVFEPFTEHIPPRDTSVELILSPKPDKEKSDDHPKSPDQLPHPTP